MYVHVMWKNFVHCLFVKKFGAQKFYTPKFLNTNTNFTPKTHICKAVVVEPVLSEAIHTIWTPTHKKIQTQLMAISRESSCGSTTLSFQATPTSV